MKSLEINWLRRHDRSLVIPEVVFVESPRINNEECGGYYVQPSIEHFAIDGLETDARFGIIVVASKWPECIPGVIAHEWRHHWQLHNGIKFDHHPWSIGDDYEESIRRYFRQSQSEFDALRFELKHAPNVFNRWHMDLVMS